MFNGACILSMVFVFVEYSNVLLELGLLRKPTSSQKSIKCNSAVASKTRMGTSGCRGAAKAMELEVVFQGITQALLEVYASEPVTLPSPYF